MMDKFVSVTIVVGSVNETWALKETVDVIMSACRAGDIEKILMVYSPKTGNETRDVIAELERRYPEKVFGFEQIRPFVGGAIRDGFDTAESSHIMLLPGDLAISLDSVPEMIDLAKENPDAVIKTSRWMESGAFESYSRRRKVLNKAAQSFLRLLFSTKLTDLTQSVQTMPTKMYRSIDFRELNFPFLLEFAVVPVKLGKQIIEIPVKCYGRTDGKSNNSFLQTAAYLKTAMRIRFTPNNNLLK